MDVDGVLNGGNLPVLVDGKFTGEIYADHITVSEHGVFAGKLFAKHAEIGGVFTGELVCEALNILATGKVDGNVRADSLSIDLGAEVLGSISRNG
jgi:cytoskeletal protein CcmA (bactofilin family)